MKITEKQKELILKLKAEGINMKEVSLKLNIPYSTVQYYYNLNTKIKTKDRSKEYSRLNPRVNNEKRREYMKKYMINYRLKKQEEKELGIGIISK